MKKYSFFLIFFLLSSGFLYASQKIILAENGNIKVKIILEKNASEEEIFAKGFLEKYLEKISGGKINSSSPSSSFLPLYLVTKGKNTSGIPSDISAGLEKEPRKESFFIRITPQKIWIVGNSPQGTLYGAFTFVEKYLGVRFFHAGPDGEHCPENRNIILAAADDFQAPAFLHRAAGGWKGSVKPWDIGNFHIWQIRNKMQVRTPQMNAKKVEKTDERLFGNMKREYGNHLTFTQSVPERLFKTHPEYFPLKNGKRTLEKRSQRCISNPEVQKKVISYGIRKGKEGALFGVGFSDSVKTWCECDNCMKMGTVNGKFSLSTLAHRFVTAMTEKILEECPDAGGQRALIYSNFRKVPEDASIQYDKKVMVLYCSHGRCYVHPVNSRNTSCNKKILKGIKEWKKRCPYMGIYDYYAYSYSPYCPLEYVLAEDLKYYYHTLGLRAFYDDNTNRYIPVTESNWQFHYVLAKMLWNPDLDVDQLMEETYTLYYGKAAETMKKYHAIRRDLWEKAPGHAGYCISTRRYRFCIPDDKTAVSMLSLLRKALKEAGKDPLLISRIRRDEKFLKEFWIAEGKKARAEMAVNKQKIKVYYTEGEKIRIDGELDENVWKKAIPVKGFLTKEKAPPPEETFIRTAYDSSFLYFGCTMMTLHSWEGKLKTDAKEKDSHVYLDDSIEFFVSHAGKDYFHFAVNSAGTLYDAKLRDPSWDSGAEIRTKVTKDFFTVEAKIPLASMRIDLTKDPALHFFFFRNCFSLQPPDNEVKFGLNGHIPHEAAFFQRGLLTNAMALPNGDFSLFEKNLKNKKFPEKWNGKNAVYNCKEGYFHLKNGSMWSKLNIAVHSGSDYEIKGILQASGKGELQLEKSSCIREKGDKRAFRHEKKETVFRIKTEEKWNTYPVSFTVKKNETGFLFLKGEDVKVKSLILYRREKK